MPTDCEVGTVLSVARQKILPLDADILLAHVLQVDRAWLLAFPETLLSAQVVQRYQQLCDQRATGIPVAWLTGRQSFWTLELTVTPDTLVPRPETELLVEAVLASVATEHAVIADLGTGCGAIALALASEKPYWEVHATDISRAALQVAEDNATRHNCKNVFFHAGDWCRALPKKPFDAIVSNPPYIAEGDPHLAHLHEPRVALCAGSDGLSAIRRLVAEAAACLKPGGALFLEHGFDQGEAVRHLLQTAGWKQVSTQQDLSGQERITQGKKHAQIIGN